MFSFPIQDFITKLEELSDQYQVKSKFNTKKDIPRNYNRCHQMFQYPSFCADGKIYTCCENKGIKRFDLGSWDQDDFRDLWLSEKHMSIYNSINTNFCPPCRSHHHNIAIQDIIDNPDKIETLHC